VPSLHLWLWLWLAGVVVLNVVALLGPWLAERRVAAAAVPMAVCLVVTALAPVVTVVGCETVGHEQGQRDLRQATAG
jgi:hypothetical protein